MEDQEIVYVSDEDERPPVVEPDGPWLISIRHHGTGGAHYGGKTTIY